ncbi:MAG: DNA topoisomerase I [Candidatus Bathyarchaeia archaeon]
MGYTLIVAEKPDAARRIAEALGEGERFERRVEGGFPYFEVVRDDRRIVVVPASGHLYTVAQKIGGRNYYPVFTYRWVPKYMAERGASKTKGIINLITRLSEEADTFINAADYDVEGSLIGYTILKYACGGKEEVAKRMKFSTLTTEELRAAYDHLMPHLDLELVEAGRTRHEVDWLYGVNLSRALTLSASKVNKRHTTLSIGRVQGPTLKYIVKREAEIRSFVPTPYWEIESTATLGDRDYPLKFEEEKVWRKRDAEEIQRQCTGKTGVIMDVEEKTVQRSPPEPFDLGSLQREAYRFFGYSPRRTLDIAERLYLDALISYPRTSSQKLPPTINYRGILRDLSKNAAYAKKAEVLLAARELKPNEGKKEDAAHPAIYPTGKPPARELTGEETKLYDLIVKRFMATFGAPAVRLSQKVTIKLGNYNFFLNGRRILAEGWTAFYEPYVEAEEVVIPSLSVGQEVKLKSVKAIQRYTEPPARYNPASLLKEMEDNGIGTKATRAQIIDTLYERGYIYGERIVATELGFTVIDAIDKYCPEVTSAEMTRELEAKMDDIEKGVEDGVSVLVDSVDRLKSVLARLKLHEVYLGADLAEAIEAEALRKRTVGPCPDCRTGSLLILRSRRTGKRFIGCTNYFKGLCSRALPIPQRAKVTPTDKTCKTCGWPLLAIKWTGRRLFHSCINPECPAKSAERGEKGETVSRPSTQR